MAMTIESAAAPQQPTISEALESLDREMSRAALLFDRVNAIADRLGGGTPHGLAKEASGADPNVRPPVLTELRERRARLAEMLSGLEKDVSRLESLI